ncbi:MAG TPA: hypothetical protein VGK70_05510 [Thermoanaerobaculia bacterium]
MGKAETLRKAARCISVALAGILVLVATEGVARAHQSPAGCNANRLDVSLMRDKSLITNGTIVNYTVIVFNPGGGSGVACDVSDLDLVFHCPGADGTPTGPATTLATSGNYPADGSGNNCYSSGAIADTCIHNAGLACTVTVNAGVTQAGAQVDVGDFPAGIDITKGALHDNVERDDAMGFVKGVAVTIVECLVDADCNDNNACNTDACVSNVCQHTAINCNDDLFCTDDSCNPASGCVHTAHVCVDDGNICTDEVCNEAADTCDHIFDASNDESCAPSVEFCRTPGFWGTHAAVDADKACSQNITLAVLGAAGGSISVCGETIDDTDVDSADSAVEAICVPVKGQQTRQLARQLTAARLNCIVSGEAGGPCNGISINDIFDACNTACAAGNVSATVASEEVSCIDAIDCFNNGGSFDPATGACSVGTCSDGGAACGPDLPCATGECVPNADNCHDTDFSDVDFALPNDSLPASNACSGKQGPAGSSEECKAAHKTPCTVIQPGEAQCLTGTK